MQEEGSWGRKVRSKRPIWLLLDASLTVCQAGLWICACVPVNRGILFTDVTMRRGEAESLVQGHTADKQPSWDQAVRAAQSSYHSLVLCPDYLAFDGTPKNVHLRIAAPNSYPRYLLIVKLSSVQKITRMHSSECCHKENCQSPSKYPGVP